MLSTVTGSTGAGGSMTTPVKDIALLLVSTYVTVNAIENVPGILRLVGVVHPTLQKMQRDSE
jgi:hypothetical protein